MSDFWSEVKRAWCLQAHVPCSDEFPYSQSSEHWPLSEYKCPGKTIVYPAGQGPKRVAKVYDGVRTVGGIRCSLEPQHIPHVVRRDLTPQGLLRNQGVLHDKVLLPT